MVILLSYCAYHWLFYVALMLFISYYFVYYIAQVIRLVSVLTVPRLYSIEVSLDTYWVPTVVYTYYTSAHFCAEPGIGDIGLEQS